MIIIINDSFGGLSSATLFSYIYPSNLLPKVFFLKSFFYITHLQMQISGVDRFDSWKQPTIRLLINFLKTIQVNLKRTNITPSD